MSCIILALFALPCLEITTTISRTLERGEVENQSEELETRLACSSQHRERLPISGRYSSRFFSENTTDNLEEQSTRCCWALVGHRLASELLAPIRC
jgi:hypothetical protein